MVYILVQKCELKVSWHFYRHFKSKILECSDPAQILMDDFLDEVSRDQLKITELIKSNAELRAQLKESAEPMARSDFLMDMIKHANKNSGKSIYASRYSEHMKQNSLYLFTLIGRHAYLTLQQNLKTSLPSLRTVRNMLGKQESIIEGQFRFEPIKERIVERKENVFVVVAEDETKIEDRLRYNSRTNDVMGLELPLTGEGIPERGVFKFTSLKKIKEVLESTPKTSYAKLMTVRTLGKNSSVYTLVIYGTTNSDNASDTLARFAFVRRSFAAIGIKVVCKLRFLQVA